ACGAVRVGPGDLAAIRLAHVREGHGGVMRVQVLDLVFAHVEGGGEERDEGRLVVRAVELEVRLPTGTDAGGEVVTGHARSDDADARRRSEAVLDPQRAREGDALDIVLAACGDAQRVAARGERGDVEARMAPGGKGGLALVPPGLSRLPAGVGTVVVRQRGGADPGRRVV